MSFTFYTTNDLCVAYETCTFSADSCTDCISGDAVGCEARNCSAPGLCAGGTVVGTLSAADEAECVEVIFLLLLQ